MPETCDAVSALLQRLEKLETRQRRLVRTLVSAPLLVFVLFLPHLCTTGISALEQDKPMRAKKLEVEELMIRDAKGKQRIELAAAANGAWIRIFNANEQEMLVLHAHEDTAQIGLVDARGCPRIGLAFDARGAGFSLYEKEKVRARFAVTDGTPYLSLLDTENRIRAKLELYDAASRLALYGRQSKPRILVDAHPDGGEFTVFGDELPGGKVVPAATMAKVGGGGTIMLFNNNLRPLFIQPPLEPK